MSEQEVQIAVGEDVVSGLLTAPEGARACYVMAHGAGVGMRHKFMADVANELDARGVATLRYQFPYMEKGGKLPDPPKVAHAAVRAAVAKAAELLPDVPLFAGGKSFGARMSSQAQAKSPLANVRGLVFLGFPLHQPAKPGDERAEHLSRVDIPMLFLQGTRDDFATPEYLKPLVGRLGSRATLILFDDADHSFHVPAKSGRKDADVMAEMLDSLVAWIERV